MEMTGQRSFLERLIGAARLDSSVHEEVEHDREATSQAAAVVILGAVAAGLAGLGAGGGVLGLVLGVVFALVGWVVYAWLTYYVGTRLLPGPETRADWGELARTLGFASGPGMLLVLGVVPVLTELVSLVVGLWILAATIVAVRAALDVPTVRAVIVAVIAWIVRGIILAVAFGLAGGGG